MNKYNTLVKCDVVDCIYNSQCECYAKEIEITLTHDSEGIGRIECANYQCKGDLVDKRVEMCPFCGSEVELVDVLKPQKCSECNEMIMPCGYCSELGQGCDFHWYNAERTVGGCKFRK
jgi:hypothetical protein